MKKLLILFLIITLFAGCQKKEHTEDKTEVSHKAQTAQHLPQKKAKRFILRDLNGTTFTIEQSQEKFLFQPSKKLTLLFFFTSWCPSCKAQLIELKEIQKKFPGLAIIGILLNQPPDAKEFVRKFSIDFFVSTSYKTNNEVASHIYKYVKAPGNIPVPMMVLLKDGKYFVHYFGAVPYEIIASDIKRAKEK
ncbi:TlpA family protein disulfide reductase [Nitratiruptor tergarcus]|uniref:AhpC/TSA family protein n=1 Tax=Nitratiruptor tergarcus DSM 16512 TaxID=1069081 RepID=A0A1W1WU32_9BACT|nr:TlpA disulfide reductase family protein [Nitratiruptor tergarcus]SMC09834.1 AhpC/TSA family protein [Nitratiruptor tergarcus DSM 16512]